MMGKFHDIDQNTDEWLQLRSGKLTGSGFSKIMAAPKEYLVVCVSKDVYAIVNNTTKKVLAPRYNLKVDAEFALQTMLKKDLTKSFGEPAKKYAVEIAIEQITGQFIESNYSNAHMERGHLQEPIARMLYEDEYFCDISNGGFYDCGFVGVSPDGVPCEEGLIEIKSVIASVHYANIKRQSVDPAYKWQHVGNMKFAEKEWIDFVSYCADFPPDKQLYVFRLHAKDCTEQYDIMDARIEQFKKLVEDTKKTILESKYSIY